MYKVIWWNGVNAIPQESGIVSTHDTLLEAIKGIWEAPECTCPPSGSCPRKGLPSVRVGNHVRVIDDGDRGTFCVAAYHYPKPKEQSFFLDLEGEEAWAMSRQHCASAEEAETCALRMEEIAAQVIARGRADGAFAEEKEEVAHAT